MDGGRCTFEFDSGTLSLTEAGRRSGFAASFADEAAMAAIDPAGWKCFPLRASVCRHARV